MKKAPAVMAGAFFMSVGKMSAYFPFPVSRTRASMYFSPVF